jgi:hypothetical protein
MVLSDFQFNEGVLLSLNKYAKDDAPQHGTADGGNTPHLCEECYRSRLYCVWHMISPRLWHFWILSLCATP